MKLIAKVSSKNLKHTISLIKCNTITGRVKLQYCNRKGLTSFSNKKHIKNLTWFTVSNYISNNVKIKMINKKINFLVEKKL